MVPLRLLAPGLERSLQRVVGDGAESEGDGYGEWVHGRRFGLMITI
jgi:hypothetical protein